MKLFKKENLMKFKNILIPMALLFTNINFGLANKNLRSTEINRSKVKEVGVEELLNNDSTLKGKLASDPKSSELITLLKQVINTDIAFGFGSAYLKSENAGRESLMNLLSQYVEYNSKNKLNPNEFRDSSKARALIAISRLGQSTKYEQEDLKPIFNKLTELASKLPDYIREERSISDSLSQSTNTDKSISNKLQVVRSWGELINKISSFSRINRAGETKTGETMDILEYIKSVTPPNFVKQLIECNG